MQSCPLALLGTLLSLMFQVGLDLENVFEDRGVCSDVITDSLASSEFMRGVP